MVGYIEFYRIYQFTENTGKAWEHDSLYGHSNNVCSAVFHDKLVKIAGKINFANLFIGHYHQ